MGIVELEFPARPEYLALARVVVAAAAGVEPRFRDDRIEDLRIAVSEAATNAVEAHTNICDNPAAGERILIRCDLSGEAIEVEVRDHGGGFDEAEVAAHPPLGPDDPERLDHERGLGLPLMSELADEAEITSGDGGTTVRLVVYHPGSHGRPPGMRGSRQSEPGVVRP